MTRAVLTTPLIVLALALSACGGGEAQTIQPTNDEIAACEYVETMAGPSAEMGAEFDLDMCVEDYREMNR